MNELLSLWLWWVRWMGNIRYCWLEYWNVMWIWNRYIVVRELESYIDGKYKRLWLGHWKLWWALHDTEISVPSRDDNCRLANRQLFVLMILFGLIRPGIIGRLIERKWPTVVWHWIAQPFPFCNGNRIGVLSLDIAREGNCPLIMERDTVSKII